MHRNTVHVTNCASAMCVCVCVWADRGAHVLTAGLCYSNAGRGCTGLLERSPSCLLVTLQKGAMGFTPLKLETCVCWNSLYLSIVH